MAPAKLTPEKHPRIQKAFADNKYDNKTLRAWLRARQVPYEIEISVKDAAGRCFKPLKIRRVVEQAHACHGRRRRLSKDYERRTSSSETRIQLSAVRRMLRRMKPGPNNRQAAFKYPKKDKQPA